MPVSDELVAEITAAADEAVTESQDAGDAGDAGEGAGEAGEAGEGKADDVGDADDSGKTGDAGDPGEGADEGGEGDETGDTGDDSGKVADDAGKAGDDDAGKGKKAGPEPVTISDDALSAAVIAGIPLAEARSFRSEEALLRVVDTIRSTVESQIAAAGANKTDGEGAAGKKEDEDLLANLPELDPELAPEIRQTFDTLKDVVRKQQETIKSFQAQQEQTVTANQQAAAQELQQWFDTQVDNLGEDFAEALGKGAMSTLGQGSSQYAKRDQIANQMAVLLAGYRASGQQVPPREQVFGAAAKLVLADEFAAVRERELGKDLARRAGQHIHRAGGKKTKTSQSPQDETAALIDEKFFPKGR